MTFLDFVFLSAMILIPLTTFVVIVNTLERYIHGHYESMDATRDDDVAWIFEPVHHDKEIETLDSMYETKPLDFTEPNNSFTERK